MKNILFILLLFTSNLLAQVVEEQIVIQSIAENEFKFSSIDTPLTQITGAPEPFYTYWWEFGDGHYSTADFPTHTYRKSGNHDILLARTNNYDDGRGRGKKKKSLNVGNGAMASLSDEVPYLEKNEILRINKNQSPKANEEIVFVQTYKNTSKLPQAGTLLFFYNEKVFENKHFEFEEYRRHYNEKRFDAEKNDILKSIEVLNEEKSFSSIDNNELILASNSNEIMAFLNNEETSDIKQFNNSKLLKKEIQQAFESYYNVLAWNFEDLNSQEERNLFLSFKTTNDMLEDTNVSISVQSIFIPNDLSFATRVKESMPIVTAHDPNKLIVNKAKTYRGFSKQKSLEYEIKFQNVGKGPAEEVKLRFYNDADIDIKNLEVLDFEPKCDFCKENCTGSYFDTIVTKEYVEFFFHNVYLPGTRQSDLESRDASKGFVKFKINTKKRIKKNDLTCRTEIYFDKEDPIKTNHAKTRFQKRMYFGLETGVSYLPISFPKYDLMLRGTFTYRLTNNWYYRAELGVKYIPLNTIVDNNTVDTTNSIISFVRNFDLIDDFGDTHTIDTTITYDYISKIETVKEKVKKQSIILDVVPVSIRRDINKFLSVGFGLHTAFNLVSFNKQELNNATDIYKIEVREDTILTPLGPVGQPTGFNLTYEAELIGVNRDNDLSTSLSSNNSSKTYQLDFTSGLFADINIGKIYSFPYLGVRAKVDYNFTHKKVLPALQFYIGAKF